MGKKYCYVVMLYLAGEGLHHYPDCRVFLSCEKAREYADRLNARDGYQRMSGGDEWSDSPIMLDES